MIREHFRRLSSLSKVIGNCAYRQPANRSTMSRLRIEPLECRQLLTTVIRSPAAVVVNTGGEAPPSLFGDHDIDNTFDRGGLDPFVSGVTNFDTYIATNPMHTAIAAKYEWWSRFFTEAATIVYDMSAAFTLDRMAFWNEESAGVASITVSTSNDPAFTTSTIVGTFVPTDNTTEAERYSADIWDLTDTTARYVRIEITGPQTVNTYSCLAIGEIAFSTSPPFVATISDATVTEGNSGTTSANFNVSLDRAPATGQTVTVQFVTSDGTATAGRADYHATNGSITFGAGETSKTISVEVNGDR